MIQVVVKRKDNQIIEFTVKGHANSAVQGEDLVCSGVSSVMVGALNAIEQLCENSCELDMKKGYVHILVNTQSEKLQIILDTVCIQLACIHEVHNKFIKINDQEV